MKAKVVEVPMEIDRRQRPPLLHWGEALAGTAVLSIEKALRDFDESPRYGIEAGYPVALRRLGLVKGLTLRVRHGGVLWGPEGPLELRSGAGGRR